jgi:hypothetical protein
MGPFIVAGYGDRVSDGMIGGKTGDDKERQHNA